MKTRRLLTAALTATTIFHVSHNTFDTESSVVGDQLDLSDGHILNPLKSQYLQNYLRVLSPPPAELIAYLQKPSSI